ncbi:unnamed protein product [marine sediment metagenome]|uniref:Uncharacterized protein n=1 Tax=marine sediment metagenome TaxID=412755 RepID=X1HJY8_9ZZZZ
MSESEGENRVSLSEDERVELEGLRNYYIKSRARNEAAEKFETAFMLRGAGLMFLFWLIIPYFTLDKNITMFGIFSCIAVGALSTYYGPLKVKKEMVKV